MKNYIKTIFVTLIIASNVGAQEMSLDKIIATVGNEIILQSDIQGQINHVSQTSGGFISKAQECSMFEDLLFQKLLVNQARLDSLVVPEAQIEGEMNSKIQYFLSQLGGDQKALENFYGKSIEGMKQDFRGLIEDRLLAEMMQQQIMQSVSVTPSDVYTFYQNIPKDSLPIMDEQYEVEILVIKPLIEQQDVDKVKADLELWRDQVATGQKSMSTIAVLYSEDPGTRSKGGKTGFQPRGTFVPEFEEIAYNLEKGEVSRVFETEYGYHFMQLIERRGESVNVAHILKKAKVRPENLISAKQKADSVYQLLATDSISFKYAVKSFSEDEKTNNNNGIIQNPYTMGSRFDAKLLQQYKPQVYNSIRWLSQNQLSKPFLVQNPVDGEAYVIARVTYKKEKHKANLQDDYQMIENATKSELQQKEFMNWISKQLYNTYIRVNKEYINCEFDNNWLKN